MDKHFGYFRQPTPKELDALLTSGLIAFDANVLLNLYRYSPDTRREFVDILAKSRSQLWLPHQAGLEFHRNRLSVMQTHAAQFAATHKSVEALRAQIGALYRTPMSAPAAKKSPAESALDTLLEYLDKAAANCIAPTNDISKDSVWRQVVALFGDSVGDPYDDNRTTELHKEASERFDLKRPPGYADDGKPAPERYGDFILWRQVIDKALSAEHPVILVTDDRKADWWAMLDGKTLGPLPALREEMRRLANQPFHMYNPGLFMEKMAARLKVTASEPALAEVRSLPPISADRRPVYGRPSYVGFPVMQEYARAREQLEVADARYADARQRVEYNSALIDQASPTVPAELRQRMALALRELNDLDAERAGAIAVLRAADERQQRLARTAPGSRVVAGLVARSRTPYLPGPSNVPTSELGFSVQDDLNAYPNPLGPTGPTGPTGPSGPVLPDDLYRSFGTESSGLFPDDMAAGRGGAETEAPDEDLG